jgi:hypothetical protein
VSKGKGEFRLYQAAAQGIEVAGQTMVAVTSGILVGSVARELLAREGLQDIQADGWYPQQKWLNVYRSIGEYLGADTLYSIGRRIPYSADFPDEAMTDVPTALAAIDVAYHTAHRGGEIGHYRFVEVGLDHFEMHCANPYPNEFDLGIITAMIERYRGRMHFDVRLESPAVDPYVNNACVIGIRRV